MSNFNTNESPRNLKYTEGANAESERDRLTESHAKTFGEKSRPITLHSGTVLYRLCSGSRRFSLSDYWIDQSTFGHLISQVKGAADLVKKNSSVSYQKNEIRNTLALLEKWGNSLDFSQKIVLKRDVIAYKGIVKSQSLFVKEVKGRIGPRLKNKHSDSIERRTEHRRGTGEIFDGVDIRIKPTIQYVIPRFSSKYNAKIADNQYVEGEAKKLFKG